MMSASARDFVASINSESDPSSAASALRSASAIRASASEIASRPAFFMVSTSASALATAMPICVLTVSYERLALASASFLAAATSSAALTSAKATAAAASSVAFAAADISASTTLVSAAASDCAACFSTSSRRDSARATASFALRSMAAARV